MDTGIEPPAPVDYWVRSPDTYPLSHRLLRRWDRYRLYKTLARNDNSLMPLGVKAVVLETCLNPPRGRGEKRIATLAGEDDMSQALLVTKLQ